MEGLERSWVRSGVSVTSNSSRVSTVWTAPSPDQRVLSPSPCPPSLPRLPDRHTYNHNWFTSAFYPGSDSSAYYTALWDSPRADLVGRRVGSHSLAAAGTASPLAQIQIRYGYTQDWLSSNPSDSKNTEKGNWSSDDSSIREERSPVVCTVNSGIYAGVNQYYLSGEIADNSRPNNPYFSPNPKGRRKTLPAQAAPTRMSEDLYELLQSPLEGKSLSDNPGPRPGKEQLAETFSMTWAPNKDKDLPPAPGFTRMASEATVVVTSVNVLGMASNVKRPSVTSQISFQRPRRRVNWRGKACIIALPSDDGYDEKTSRREYLKPQDVLKRLEMWERQGYQTKGFSLSSIIEGRTEHLSEGQSRVVYPSLDDQMDERVSKRYRVRIPDRQEWDDYVGRLKEDKLRALGVSFESEVSSSRNSPIPPSMSRHTSSHNSSIQISPKLVTSLSYGNFGQYSNQVSPRLGPSISSGPQIISQVSSGSQHAGKAGSNRPQSCSTALPVVEKTWMPAYQFPQVPPPIAGAWSFQQHLGSPAISRVTTPSFNGYVQDFRPILTPGSISSPDHGYAMFSHASHRVSPHTYQQQAQIQTPYYLQDYEQHQKFLHSLPKHTAANPHSPANGSRSIEVSHAPEIINPVPRGHHQNLSETLQKGIDEAELHVVAPAIVANKAKEKSESHMGDRNEGGEEPPILANLLQSTGKDLRLEDSDLDTNPSIACTPKPSETLPAGFSQEHSSKLSLSKMNANAPEFVYNPIQPIPSESFAFSSHQTGAQPILKLATGTLTTTDHMPEKSIITSTLNSAAPAFTPASSFDPPYPSRVFSFSSSGPSFKPKAPESSLVTMNGNLNVGGAISGLPVGQKIFSNINLADIVKPAKKSRAIPIVRPKQHDKSYDQDSDGQEDESGRITQADGRQKRIRHHNDEGDKPPLFAYPDSEMHSSQELGPHPESNLLIDTTNIIQGNNLARVTTSTGLEEPVDGITASGETYHAGKPDVVNIDSKTWEPFPFDNVNDAARFNEACSALRSSEDDSAIKSSFTLRVLGTERNSTSDITQGTSPPLTAPDDFEPNIISAIRDVEQDSLPASLDRSESPRSPRRAGNGASLPPSYPNKIPLEKTLSESPFSTAIKPQDGQAELRDFELPGVIDNVRCNPQPELAPINGATYLESSYDEIDAVMKQLNEEDSDIGVERLASPWQNRSPIRTSVSRDNNQNRHEQLPLTAYARKDAPLSSPNKTHESSQYLPERDFESPSTALIGIREKATRYSPSQRLSNIAPDRSFFVQRLNRSNDLPVSDWDDVISSSDEVKFHSRIKFFDHRIEDLIGGIVQQRLQPFEKVLVDIQDLLAASPIKPVRSIRRSTSAEVETSDADDEDDSEGSHSKAKSPGKDRTYEKLKLLLMEMVEARSSNELTGQMAEILETIKDLKSSVQRPLQSHNEIKLIVEEAIARQMRGRSAPITSSHESATVEKLQLQIAGLESMLKIADTRADDELQARRATEDALADNQRLLRMAMQEAAEQRESAEETERSLIGFHDERQQMLRRTAMLEGAQESLRNTASDLAAKNAALEETLDEYRLSSSQWREEVEEAKRENKDLLRTISGLKVEIEETIRGRQALSNKFDRLQEDMALASRDIARDQSRWRAREEEATTKLEVLNKRLESELRSKEELESSVKRLSAQQKEFLDLQCSFERSQRENADLERLLAVLKTEISEQNKDLAGYKSEIHHTTETARLELQRIIEAKDAEIETASNQVSIISADLQAVIARLRSQINNAAEDAKAAKARHDAILAEFVESKDAALREAADVKKAALEENSQFHQRILSEANSQHARALNNTLEDKARAEAYFNERLTLANERVSHLEDKSNHLEGKLEIAQSAAHAAAIAAQSKRATSSPSASGTSPKSKDYDLPEKISPQALRESILVLQEQLQERESHVERLEKELLQFDTASPEKLRNQEMEITWLRELLCVRMDDIEEIISTLSDSSYDREAVRDAAIRIKTNLQMEQQGKERAAAMNSKFPSLSTISTIASSPRALPLAAAAAWGNWRKAQDTSSRSNLSIATVSGNQTPPRSSSPARGFLSGLLTPPRTNTRQSPSLHLATNRKRTTPAQKLTSVIHRTGEESLDSEVEAISSGCFNQSATPPLMRESSYDRDAESTGFSNEFGDVATEIQHTQFIGATLGEPFGLSQEYSSP